MPEKINKNQLDTKLPKNHHDSKTPSNVSDENSNVQKKSATRVLESEPPTKNILEENESTSAIKLTENDSGQIKDLVSQQQFNEHLIKLLVLLYQIDNKITLTEQDYFEDLIEKLNWNSGVSISAFISDAIHQARVAIDHGEEREFLFSLAKGLNHDPAEAFEHAMNLTAVDGKRSDEELEMLSLLSNRVLAKGLVA